MDLIIKEQLPRGYEALAHALGRLDCPPTVIMILDGSEEDGRLGVVPFHWGTSAAQITSSHGATFCMGATGGGSLMASCLAPGTAAAMHCLFDVNRQTLTQCGHLWDILQSTVPEIAGLIEGCP